MARGVEAHVIHPSSVAVSRERSRRCTLFAASTIRRSRAGSIASSSTEIAPKASARLSVGFVGRVGTASPDLLGRDGDERFPRSYSRD